MFFWLHGVTAQNWVYADGRLIRLGGSWPTGRSAATVSLPRATPHTRGSQALAIRDRLGRRVRTRSAATRQRSPLQRLAAIQVRKGDRLVPLTWASDLKRLQARLANPASWLPASAWKQRKFSAYVPSRFPVCAAAVVNDKTPGWRVQQMRPARIVTLLPAGSPERAPRQGLECERGRARGCFAVTTNEARSLAKALDGAGPAKKGPLELQIQCPRPEPTGLDRLQAVPPARRDHLLAVRMSSRRRRSAIPTESLAGRARRWPQGRPTSCAACRVSAERGFPCTRSRISQRTR